jgi:hypothetical protein
MSRKLKKRMTSNTGASFYLTDDTQLLCHRLELNAGPPPCRVTTQLVPILKFLTRPPVNCFVAAIEHAWSASIPPAHERALSAPLCFLSS